MAGAVGLEPTDTGVKVLCLDRLGDAPMSGHAFFGGA